MKTLSEVGTLEEIGANVGDVVEYFCRGIAGGHRTIKEKTLPFWIAEDGGPMCQGSPCWRMIRRAPDAKPGPVREVTRKEIVPGVYGKVSVDKNVSGGHNVSLCAYSATRADLIAARDVFSQLIDALEGE